MAPEALIESLAFTPPVPRDQLPDMFDLPSENPEDPGLPNLYHYLQPPLLDETFKVPMKAFTAGEMHVYYDPENPRRYRRPDWFAALGVEPMYEGHLRESFVVWQEGVRPFIIVELLSYSTMDEDLGTARPHPGDGLNKLEVYRDILRVPVYIVFDREEIRNTTALRLEAGSYRRIDCVFDDRVHLPVPEIGLTLVSWFGKYRGNLSYWLRWAATDGALIPTSEERAEQSERDLLEERAENRKREARLRALLHEAGIDPDKR